MNRFMLIATFMAMSPAIAIAENFAMPDRYQFCAVCHGAKFQGNASTDSPNLSILSTWYLENQLMNYKHGLRGWLEADTFGREMQPMLTTLDNNAIWEVSALIGALEAQVATVTINGNVTRGRRLYQSCTQCHGAKGLGSEAFRAPRLAGQLPWYLIRQLNGYIRGLRGASKRDPYGAQMRAATSTLNDPNAVRDVVAFINTL